jgi:serine/threonine protein kinase
MKYLRNDPLRWDDDRGFTLTPMSRQIILYGVASALEILHRRGQTHQNIQPANILLDKRDRPRLTNVAIRSWVSPSVGVAQGPCLRYLAPEAYSPTAKLNQKMDCFSFAILLYEFVEDRPAVIPTNTGETPVAALLRGARPVVSDAGRRFEPLLSSLWDRRPMKRQEMSKVRQYFEDSGRWVPGVNPQLFWGTRRISKAPRRRRVMRESQSSSGGTSMHGTRPRKFRRAPTSM